MTETEILFLEWYIRELEAERNWYRQAFHDAEERIRQLLEEKDGERLDTGTTGTAGQTDPAIEAVGEDDGTEDAEGQEQGLA